MNFRDKTPIRRTNPSSQSNYTRYRDELRSDFNCRCGYCHTHDFFRSTYYEIDHFVPKTIIKTIEHEIKTGNKTIPIIWLVLLSLK